MPGLSTSRARAGSGARLEPDANSSRAWFDARASSQAGSSSARPKLQLGLSKLAGTEWGSESKQAGGATVACRRRGRWSRPPRVGFAPFGAEGGSFGTYSMAVHAYRWSAAGRSGEMRWRPAGRQDRSRSGRLEEKEAEAAEGWEREGSCFGSGPGGKKRLVTGTGRGGRWEKMNRSGGALVVQGRRMEARLGLRAPLPLVLVGTWSTGLQSCVDQGVPSWAAPNCWAQRVRRPQPPGRLIT